MYINEIKNIYSKKYESSIFLYSGIILSKFNYFKIQFN